MKLRITALSAMVVLGACRGDISEAPPVHLISDMRHQSKYLPEQKSTFFADGRAMRTPVEGTVARGALDLPEEPGTVDRALLLRGRERFNIYCSACHDRSGSGHGMIVQRGYPPPVDLSSQRVRDFSDREVYDVITHGVRNMPSYAPQIPEADRWAIVSWLRVLQRSQNSTLEDVPESERPRIEPEAP